MAENISIWNELKTPPDTALSTIKAGRLKGKFDINPQWRLQKITEQFGPCGVGWKYTIDKQWSESGADGTLMCFVNVSVFIPAGFEWSEPIPGTGGSMLIAKETVGLHTSDEGYKMALTDALSVAFKALGLAADVYLGIFDSKYNKPRGGSGAQSTGSSNYNGPEKEVTGCPVPSKYWDVRKTDPEGAKMLLQEASGFTGNLSAKKNDEGKWVVAKPIEKTETEDDVPF